MTQEEVHDLAVQDALLMCPKLKGFTWEQQVMHRDAFIRGYEVAQKTMFSEEEILKNFTPYVSFSDLSEVMNEMKENKNKMSQE